MEQATTMDIIEPLCNGLSGLGEEESGNADSNGGDNGRHRGGSVGCQVGGLLSGGRGLAHTRDTSSVAHGSEARNKCIHVNFKVIVSTKEVHAVLNGGTNGTEAVAGIHNLLALSSTKAGWGFVEDFKCIVQEAAVGVAAAGAGDVELILVSLERAKLAKDGVKAHGCEVVIKAKVEAARVEQSVDSVEHGANAVALANDIQGGLAEDAIIIRVDQGKFLSALGEAVEQVFSDGLVHGALALLTEEEHKGLAQRVNVGDAIVVRKEAAKVVVVA